MIYNDREKQFGCLVPASRFQRVQGDENPSKGSGINAKIEAGEGCPGSGGKAIMDPIGTMMTKWLAQSPLCLQNCRYSP